MNAVDRWMKGRLGFCRGWAVICYWLLVWSGPVFGAGVYASWTNGPSSAPDFFPIAVWLQDPANAERYREAGFNTYVGLWQGPTEAQLAQLKAAGLRVICEQNEVGRRHLADPTICGWMHGDEPDNAQSRGARLGWSAPIPPDKVVETYQRLRAADPSRPVLLNLGQGVAWDRWYGRGSRSNHPEDYPEYLAGGDIVSFDIYPVVHDSPEVAGKLWFVAQGVERLVKWGGGRKVVWNCLECTRISNTERKPTPQQVRAEAWMALIHGSQGLIYFVHQFKPEFREAALLDEPEMLAAVTRLNKEIQGLARVLNSPKLEGQGSVHSENSGVPVAFTVRRSEGATYLLAVAMREGSTAATFSLAELRASQKVEVLGEGRTIRANERAFQDHFRPWEVHLYRLANQPDPGP